MRAVRRLSDIAASGEATDRSGGGRLVEAYPAAARSVLGFRSTGHKRKVGAPLRRELVSGLGQRTVRWLEIGDEVVREVEASDDVPDALIASLIARAIASVCARRSRPRKYRRRGRKDGSRCHVPAASKPFEIERIKRAFGDDRSPDAARLKNFEPNCDYQRIL